MSKWISVKNRLPDDKQKCLIYSNKNIDPIYVAYFMQGENKKNGPWKICDTGYKEIKNENPWAWGSITKIFFSQEVSHWMPLPDAPEDE